MSATEGDGNQETSIPPEGEKDLKSFTQEDLKRIAAREKEQGQRAGADSVLKALGFTSVEEAKSFAKKVREAEEKKLSEADLAAKRAAEAESKAAEREREADQKVLNARKLEALVTTGLKMDQAKIVVDMVKVSPDATDEAIQDTISELRKSLPQLFPESSGDGKDKQLPNSQPKNKPSLGKPEPSRADKARELLYERHPHLKKGNP